MTNDLEKTSHSHEDLYCYCLHASLCQKCGKPRQDKEDTRAAVQFLTEQARPAMSNVYGHGPLLISDIPKSSVRDRSETIPGKSSRHIVVGIDEAGRGSVLGPMVYGMAYWSVDAQPGIPSGFNDSKQLSEETREKLWKQLLDHDDIGFGMSSLLPSEISRNMLRTMPYNLNEQSHDTAMVLIRKLVQANLQLQTCYIDTVGNASSYRRKLEREFPGIEFVVESKADAKYAPCSAASVVAKVMRDRFLESWKFSEPFMDTIVDNEFGSGYPSDPKCKAWMDKSMQDPVFGFCDLVRFSWAPSKQRLQDEKKAIPVTFEADLDDEENENLQQQKGLSAFLIQPQKGPTKKRKRSSYFEQRKLQVATL